MNRHYRNRSSAHFTNELQLDRCPVSYCEITENRPKWYLSLICPLPIKTEDCERRRIAVAGFAFISFNSQLFAICCDHVTYRPIW